MHRNLDTSLLRAFVAVADSGSVTGAADRLSLTQGAVSQQIRRLEEALRSTLFDRSRRALSLTREGEQLLGPSKRMLALNDEIWTEMTMPAIIGQVRLGIPHDLVTTYLPLALEGFAAAHPHIEISLVSDSSPRLTELFAKGEVDVAIAEEPLGQTDGERLGTDPLVWVGTTHGQASRKRPLPLSMICENCAFRAPIVDALNHNSIAWRTVFENGTTDATLTTVRADMAVTVSLASVVPDDLEVLSADHGLPDLPSFAINLYAQSDSANPAANELSQHLRDKVGQRRR